MPADVKLRLGIGAGPVHEIALWLVRSRHGSSGFIRR